MDRCPYLVDVSVDWLWLYPGGVFCRRPDGRIRIPAPGSVAGRCEGQGFLQCDGYVTATREGGEHGA